MDIRYLIVNQLQIHGRISHWAIIITFLQGRYFSDLGILNWRNTKTATAQLLWCHWRFSTCVLRIVNDPRRCFVVCCWSVRLIAVISKAIREVTNTLNQMSSPVTQGDGDVSDAADWGRCWGQIVLCRVQSCGDQIGHPSPWGGRGEGGECPAEC